MSDFSYGNCIANFWIEDREGVLDFLEKILEDNSDDRSPEEILQYFHDFYESEDYENDSTINIYDFVIELEGGVAK